MGGAVARALPAPPWRPSAGCSASTSAARACRTPCRSRRCRRSSSGATTCAPSWRPRARERAALARRCAGRPDGDALRRDLPGANLGADPGSTPPRASFATSTTRGAFRPVAVPVFLDEIEELWGTGARLEVFAPSVARRRAVPALVRPLRAAVALAAHAALPIVRVALREGPPRGVLPAIRVPTLVLHRAGNRFIHVRHGRYLAEHIPGAKYVELPGRRPSLPRGRHRGDPRTRSRSS